MQLSCSIFHFGLDTVRFNFESGFEGEFFKSLMRGLSLNSPQNNDLSFYGKKMTGIFSSTRDKNILQLVYQGDAVVCIEEYVNTGVVRTISWSVIFYSAFFYIPGLQSILVSFIDTFKNRMWVGRCDLCLDVSASVDELWQNHTTNAVKKMSYEKFGGIETFYLGSKVKNQKHFIRVYNKKLDSEKKGKFHLFLDYIVEPCVSRIELQMNSLSCKMYSVSSEDIAECLNFDFFKEGKCRLFDYVFTNICLNKKKTCFNIGKLEKVDRRLGYVWKNAALVLDELPYANTMLGYARRLDGLGFDVIGYLTKKLKKVDFDPVPEFDDIYRS